MIIWENLRAESLSWLSCESALAGSELEKCCKFFAFMYETEIWDWGFSKTLFEFLSQLQNLIIRSEWELTSYSDKGVWVATKLFWLFWIFNLKCVVAKVQPQPKLSLSNGEKWVLEQAPSSWQRPFWLTSMFQALCGRAVLGWQPDSEGGSLPQCPFLVGDGGQAASLFSCKQTQNCAEWGSRREKRGKSPCLGDSLDFSLQSCRSCCFIWVLGSNQKLPLVSGLSAHI